MITTSCTANLATFFASIARIIATPWYTITADGSDPARPYTLRILKPRKGVTTIAGFADVTSAFVEIRVRYVDDRAIYVPPVLFARLVESEVAA